MERSSEKMKVLGAEVARTTRSAAARGEEADLVSARNGCRRWLARFRAAMMQETYLQRVQSFGLLHFKM